MAMLYNEIVQNLEVFLDYDPSGGTNATRGLINSAVRYISQRYNNRWKHLLRRQQTVTLDSDLVTVPLPSDFGVLEFIALFEREGGQMRRERNYYIETSSPSDLLTAPTKTIRFWFKKTAGSEFFMNYWRSIKEFDDQGATDQFPDIPNSGEAILAVAKWLGTKDDTGSPQSAIATLRAEAMEKVGDLKNIDSGYDSDASAPETHVDHDPQQYVHYNQFDGGEDDSQINQISPVIAD